jgi:Tfp pilus assembly protein PilO
MKMHIPKNYFNNLSASKYREYLKLLPSVQQENLRVITTLIFTFSAMTFFGIFAINPTLSTIVTLQKQLADSEMVYESLKTKVSTLSSLQQQYGNMQGDLPIIFDAIPKTPDSPILTAQILGLAKQMNIKIVSLTTSEVMLKDSRSQQPAAQPQGSPGTDIPGSMELPGGMIPPGAPTSMDQTESNPMKSENDTSYSFTLQTEGSYEQLMSFAKALSNINRILNIDSLTISKKSQGNELTMGLSGKVYFQKL